MGCFEVSTNLQEIGCFKVSTNLDEIGCFKVGVLEIPTDAPCNPIIVTLTLLSINGESLILNKNTDNLGNIYIKDDDIVVVEITNYDSIITYTANADTDTYDGEIILVEGTITLNVGNNLEGVQKQLEVFGHELNCPDGDSTYIYFQTMYQSATPILDEVSNTTSLVEIDILNYNANNIYTFTVDDGSVTQNGNILNWVPPTLTEDTTSFIRVKVTEPLKYESSEGNLAVMLKGTITSTCTGIVPNPYSECSDKSYTPIIKSIGESNYYYCHLGYLSIVYDGSSIFVVEPFTTSEDSFFVGEEWCVIDGYDLNVTFDGKFNIVGNFNNYYSSIHPTASGIPTRLRKGDTSVHIITIDDFVSSNYGAIFNSHTCAQLAFLNSDIDFLNLGNGKGEWQMWTYNSNYTGLHEIRLAVLVKWKVQSYTSYWVDIYE